jgi:MFS transporter, FHS family, glucose/mannose:H+ symporter
MRTTRVWLSGFLLLGILLGLLGSLLVAWRYQNDVDPELIGLHFLCLNTGYIIAAAGVQRLLGTTSARKISLGACGISFLSLLGLALAAPPVSPGWRLAGLAGLGIGAGALGSSLLYAAGPYFEERTTAGIDRAAALFGCGCLISTVTVGGTYFLGSVQIETALLSLIPLLFLFLFIRAKPPRSKPSLTVEQERLRNTLEDLRSIATVLFTFVVFFQFGNEWAIAGWLPMFLVRKLGSNPALAIAVLAGYFLTLTVGRIASRRLLPRFSPRKLLVTGIAVAMCGFVLVSISDSLVGATIGAIIIAVGYAPIYPLIAERLDHRFSFHPDFYNGTILVAISGAMCAPWLLGFVAGYLGIRYVMLLPALGSIFVLVLSLLLMLEAHLMKDETAAPVRARSKAAGGF